MPEVTPDATLIIATSWQALSRAETGDERASICNCTVIIVFAAFFIEANLNHFIDKAGARGMRPAPTDFDGLHAKLAWVYNSFIADNPVTSADELANRLEEAFPGIQAIRTFRNGVSHGVIDRFVANLAEARRLRLAAKNIVDRLLAVARQNNIDIQRGIEYEMAIHSSDAGAAA